MAVHRVFDPLSPETWFYLYRRTTSMVWDSFCVRLGGSLWMSIGVSTMCLLMGPLLLRFQSCRLWMSIEITKSLPLVMHAFHRMPQRETEI